MRHHLRKYGRRVMTTFLASTMAVSVLPAQVLAAETYYIQSNSEIVTKGVVYENSNRMTDAGVQNVHVLTVDLTESSLEFKPVLSETDYGYKESTSKLLSTSGAVAGVNGDFFGTSGTYSAPFGPIMIDGDFIAVGASINQTEDEYTAFFMDEDGDSVFSYFGVSLSFTNGYQTLSIASENKVASIDYPVYIDRSSMNETDSLDERFDNMVKIVVEDDEIDEIITSSKSVDVPRDGYVIVMTEAYFEQYGTSFAEGDDVEYERTTSIDIDDMEFGFGGGAKLVEGGEKVAANAIVVTGRQPRTAFGLSRDGNTAIFLVVDGRGNSIGATHDELAAMMLEYGAFNAFHLDGGGSSTLVAQTVSDSALEVKNTVSDGSERNVINAVGIFQNAKVGSIEEIRITADMDRTLPNKVVAFTAYGLDDEYNHISIDQNDIEWSALGMDGEWNGNQFTPATVGEFMIEAKYGNDVGYINFVSATTSRLNPTNTEVAVANVGGTASMEMSVVDTDGFSHWCTSTTEYRVADESIGTMNKNVFTAKAKGSTYIICTRDGQESYIAVTVGGGDFVTLPDKIMAADHMAVDVQNTGDGAFYLNILGGLVSEKAAEVNLDAYITARTNARVALDTGAEVAVYGGSSNIQTANQTDTLTWLDKYRFMSRGGVSLAMVTAANGGINSTDGTQWNSLVTNLDASDDNVIIVVTERTPSNFTDDGEATFYREILGEYVNEGKDVFVVSCSGSSAWATVLEGIRYINLPDLWLEDGSLNSAFSMLRFRVSGDTVQYELEKVQ
ncbi:phosphodiester glycosidase family protein [Chakrabartyella piscis]|uniref:phosphodiester glycosidase family protein n=1 Tax=Chakrabartyella piscis TaxID=2918914 RepID=UPI002958505B|nr:phosphodiester glycosidase family protein [Chakrabartyella piscis]